MKHSAFTAQCAANAALAGRTSCFPFQRSWIFLQESFSRNTARLIFAGLYLHYDTAAEFMPQFEKNAQDFFGMMESALKEWDK